MGLLDDLKRQADMARTHDSLQRSNLQDNLRVVEEAMHTSFHYLLELFKQLDVLKPANPTSYQLEKAGAFRNLQYAGSFIDSRKKKFQDREVYDYIELNVKWAAPATTLAFEHDMPPVIQKLRNLLWLANVKFKEEETKTAHGSIAKVRFAIPAAFATSFEIKSDIEGRRLLFYGKNTQYLGLDDFAVPADLFGEPALEEFAKLLMGQKTDFTKFRASLKRT